MERPVADSPASTLQAIGDILFRTGGATGAGVALAAGVEPSWGLAGWALGALVFANVLFPATRAIGRGLEHHIDKRMGTPPAPLKLSTSQAPTAQSPEQQSVES